MNSRKDPRFNASGCKDLTSYQAIENIDNEKNAEIRYKYLITAIFKLCNKNGFHLEGRIVLRDKKTGKIWR